jgi:hypothetical protein
MQVLDPQLILMLQLLQLLLRRLLIMFLVLCGWLNSLLHVFANEQDLAVFMVDVLGLDFCPGQTAEFFNDPGHNQYRTLYMAGRICDTYSFEKSGF